MNRISEEDGTYRAVPKSEWEAICKAADEVSVKYITERRDCDDYAKYLAGFASHEIRGERDRDGHGPFCPNTRTTLVLVLGRRRGPR